jgi:hypothetical protein
MRANQVTTFVPSVDLEDRVLVDDAADHPPVPRRTA